MTFYSILFERPTAVETNEMPAFFGDLNLDQLVDTITSGKRNYNLTPFFYTPLKDIDAITYRHEIMQDLETGSLMKHIHAFARKMYHMRDNLAQANRLHYKYQKASWFLDAVECYCDGIIGAR